MNKEKRKEYYLKNKEKLKKYVKNYLKEYRKRDYVKEKTKQYNQEYYLKNKEKISLKRKKKYEMKKIGIIGGTYEQ